MSQYYEPKETRYDTMSYRKCGKSGLKLPAISLGLWHNFGDVDHFESYRKIIFSALDHGITHFDLANNYGPPPGSAESNFGTILKLDLNAHRDELIISTKAGYRMWPGPYGEWGSRKYLISSLDQSLRRMKLDYVDIFYSHRFDPDTPLEETMGALDYAVRSGRALYAGISSYDAQQTKQAADILDRLGTPCIIHQPRYSMLDRWVENGLTENLEHLGMGCIAFSPLAQGLLTNRYLSNVPVGSRASKPDSFLKPSDITDKLRKIINQLNEIAAKRGQSLAQMAISWLLKNDTVTSVLVGVSSREQLLDNLNALKNTVFSSDELKQIDSLTKGN